MAIVQGKPYMFKIKLDATKYPTVDGMKVEVFLNDSSKVLFSYPAATGYITMTLVAGYYTATIPAETTLTMRGRYGVEIELFAGSTSIDKVKNNSLVEVEAQAV